MNNDNKKIIFHFALIPLLPYGIINFHFSAFLVVAYFTTVMISLSYFTSAMLSLSFFSLESAINDVTNIFIFLSHVTLSVFKFIYRRRKSDDPSLMLRCNRRVQREFTACDYVFQVITLDEPTNVITWKTQTHAVNAR